MGTILDANSYLRGHKKSISSEQFKVLQITIPHLDVGIEK